MPKHLTPERLARVVVTSIKDNPKLIDCDESSLYKCIVQAATLGLEPDGALGLAYLIPYGREAVLVVGYKGLLQLARRSGEIKSITCEEVRLGDQFAHQLGDDARIYHVPSEAEDRDSQPVTHVYVSVRLHGGGVQRKVWTTAKIDAHKRRFSQAWKRAEGGRKDSPWHTDWVSMAKKTLVREMIQRGELPVAVELRDLIAGEEKREVDDWRNSRDTVVGLDDLTEKRSSATPDEMAADDAADVIIDQSPPVPEHKPTK